MKTQHQTISATVPPHEGVVIMEIGFPKKSNPGSAVNSQN